VAFEYLERYIKATLDGIPVYALQFAGTSGATFYFSAQSYVLERADWVQDGGSWQARLDSYRVVPISAVPSHTFGAGTDAGPPGSAPTTLQP
jgi:hypothetical protein